MNYVILILVSVLFQYLVINQSEQSKMISGSCDIVCFSVIINDDPYFHIYSILFLVPVSYLFLENRVYIRYPFS